ncbi:Uma2 family endonuclease [Thermoflexus sp.]|uniref:Uma2 family endonuclease n=1 Tax=Thermoflexus sp. TaxID=1969742 RepID=UPI003C064E6C
MAIPREAERLWTAEDLLALGEEARYELIEGRLVPMSPTGSLHGDLVAELTMILRSFVRAHQLGRVLTGEVGFVLRRNPDTVRAADIAFVRRERLPAGDLPRGFFEGAPDLVVEILSPSDRYTDILRKVGEWLEAGAAMVWVVDPEHHGVMVFRPDGTLRLLGESDSLEGEEVLPGFRYPVGELFSPLT